MKTERELFEAYVLSIRKYKKRDPKFLFVLDEDGFYDMQDIHELHHAWKASASREGYKLVPVEPTKEMLIAADCCDIDGKVTANNIYKAMIEAA